jgi:hypothetical protein
VLANNKYDLATARETSPAFAAREIAAESLRNGIYDQLENYGIDGVRELRQDQGSLIKIRNAAHNQIFNEGRTVRGTGRSGLGGRIVRGVGKAAGASIGGAAGSTLGPGGTIGGAVVGGEIGSSIANSLAPGDLTKGGLIENSFKHRVATDEPGTVKVNLQAPPDAAPAKGQKELITNPSTLFDVRQTDLADAAGPLDKAVAQSNREKPYQAVVDDPNATAAEKAIAKTAINQLRKTAPNRSTIKPSAPEGPPSPTKQFLEKNLEAELKEKASIYQAVIDDPRRYGNSESRSPSPDIEDICSSDEKENGWYGRVSRELVLTNGTIIGTLFVQGE